MPATNFSKRLLDLLICAPFLLLISVPFLFLLLLIRMTSKGPAIHWSKRIGQNNEIFLMPKLRTMYMDTPQVATDLLYAVAGNYITPIGKILRKTSLDEIPQIWSVLVGDMSLVGPRPALFNQDRLKALRTEKNVHLLKPGVTGWAQVNGRDTVTDEEKVALDAYYGQHQSVALDIKIIFMTFTHVLKSTDITH